MTPVLKMVCNSFSLSCSYCKQGAPHPSLQELDWSSEDWDGTKAKVREQTKSLIDFSDPKPQPDFEQTMDIDEVAFSKLQIGQNDLMEELPEVAKSLVPPPSATGPSEQATENTNEEGLSEAEKRPQREEEQYELYDRIYVGQLSDKEESDADTDN